MVVYKKINQYFGSHVIYNSTIHVIAGIGIGILITYPLIGAHPVRWGAVFLIAGILGHLYPLIHKG